MARIVITDAGPLIAFAGIDALCVLQSLFSEVRIAESVQRECLRKPGPDSRRIKTAVEEGSLLIFTPDAVTEPLSPGWEQVRAIRFVMPWSLRMSHY